MHALLKELIQQTQIKFGLDNYFLERHNLRRKIDIFQETDYLLVMEWFPNHCENHHDDFNPEGTAVIEMNIHSKQYENVIFVAATSFANGSFDQVDTNTIVNWVEQETGFTYLEQFQLKKKDNGKWLFQGCIDGIPVYPASSIEVKIDEDGKLLGFTVLGDFPSPQDAYLESYSLSLDDIEEIQRQQLTLNEYPLFEKEKMASIYALEEIYITNNQFTTIPFSPITDTRPMIEMNEVLDWEKPMEETFEGKSLQIEEDVSVEQGLAKEASPDVTPITKEEQALIKKEVTNFLRQEYPGDSSEWSLHSLHRENHYVVAVLKRRETRKIVFERKLKVFLEADTLSVVNYMDSDALLEIIKDFKPSNKININLAEAYQKLKDCVVLDPYYVYDRKTERFILCGKLDCSYAVDGETGEILLLDDLS